MSKGAFSVDSVTRLFNDTFYCDYHTVLEGGAEEPFYLPATASSPARLCFRLDYFRSALHEIAHWCVAGEKRRQQPDFGYWYAPEGRTAEQQEAFMRLEVLPQSYEWLFCAAAGVPFDVSLDDFSEASQQRLADFRMAVWHKTRGIENGQLPPRVLRWRQALAVQYRGESVWQEEWLAEVSRFRVPADADTLAQG